MLARLGIWFVVLMVASLPAGAQTPCPGDTDGDDRVTIAELVSAVAAALGGCPVTCPVDFDSNNMADDSPACFYEYGEGEDRGEFTFFTDGQWLIISFEEGYLFGLAGGGQALILGWATSFNVLNYESVSGYAYVTKDWFSLTMDIAPPSVPVRFLTARPIERRFPARGEFRAVLDVLHEN